MFRMYAIQSRRPRKALTLEQFEAMGKDSVHILHAISPAAVQRSGIGFL